MIGGHFGQLNSMGEALLLGRWEEFRKENSSQWYVLNPFPIFNYPGHSKFLQLVWRGTCPPTASANRMGLHSSAAPALPATSSLEEDQVLTMRNHSVMEGPGANSLLRQRGRTNHDLIIGFELRYK